MRDTTLATLKNRFSGKFTTVPNHVLKDKNLSWGAKGLLCYMLSKPEDWQFFMGDLVAQANSNPCEIKRLIKELETNRYLLRKRDVLPNSNTLTWFWILELGENLEERGAVLENYDRKNLRTSCFTTVVNYDHRKNLRYNNTELDTNTEYKDIPPISPPKRVADVSQNFEKFWQSYKPVTVHGRTVPKGSKKLAEQKYNVAIKNGANPVDILQGAEKYQAHCLQSQILTCGVSVFLNQERWKDEYSDSLEDIIV